MQFVYKILKLKHVPVTIQTTVALRKSGLGLWYHPTQSQTYCKNNYQTILFYKIELRDFYISI